MVFEVYVRLLVGVHALPFRVCVYVEAPFVVFAGAVPPQVADCVLATQLLPFQV